MPYNRRIARTKKQSRRLEDLTRDALALAAYAGHEEAAALIGKRIAKRKPWGGDVRGWIKGVQRWGLEAMLHAAAPTGSIAVATYAKLRPRDRRVAVAWRAVVAALRGKPAGLRASLAPLIAMRSEPWFMKSQRAHCASLTVLRLGQALCAKSDRAWVYGDIKHLGIARTASAETLAARAITDGVMACVSATFQARRVRDAMETMLQRYALSD